MQKEAFNNWLIENGYKLSTVNSRLTNLLTIERNEGDLDELFDHDQCSSLLASMNYSAEDQRNSRPAKHHIPIDGNIYNGTQTFKQALNLYIEFRKTYNGNILSSPSKDIKSSVSHVRRKGKTDIQSEEFTSLPTQEQLKMIKKLLKETIIFYPQACFKEYIDSNHRKGQHIQKEWPHLIFANEGRRTACRMMRVNTRTAEQYGKTAKELRGKYTHNLSDTEEKIYLTDNGNSRFNDEYGNAFLRGYEKTLVDRCFEICHIGGDTVHNLAFFAAIPNVVYAPRWIASFTDHIPEVRYFLASRSYFLYYDILKEFISADKLSDLFSRRGLLSPKENMPGSMDNFTLSTLDQDALGNDWKYGG